MYYLFDMLVVSAYCIPLHTGGFSRLLCCGSEMGLLIVRRQMKRRSPAAGGFVTPAAMHAPVRSPVNHRCPPSASATPAALHHINPRCFHRADERPELCRGTVEYLASQDYVFRPPMAPAHVFVIDVSATAIATGATASLCRAVAAALDRIQGA